MDAISGLVQLIYLHRIATGKLVKAIYMGFATKREIFSHPSIKEFVEYRSANASRPEFEGIPIYIVDEEHYLTVG